MYLCLCNAITDRDFRAQAAIANATVSTVYLSLGIRPQCGKCVPYVRQLLRPVTEISQQPAPVVTG